MKRNWLWILTACIILSGCGAGESAGDMGNGIKDLQAHGESVTESSGSTKEEAVSGSEETADSEEKYVLTFETRDTEGNVVTSECFAETKLTMLNVWATYCGPCLNEMPDLGEIAGAYEQDVFRMIGIVSDVDGDVQEDIEKAKGLISDTGADYLHILPSQSLYENLLGAVTAVPTTFFVNQKGEVLGYVVGALAKDDWEELIDDLLAKEK